MYQYQVHPKILMGQNSTGPHEFAYVSTEDHMDQEGRKILKFCPSSQYWYGDLISSLRGLAASKSTRCSKTQEETSKFKTLLSVLSSARLVSFGGSSLVALMVRNSVPKSLSASKLAYEENLAELEKEATKNSFKRQSLILPSLFFSILCFASLCLTWCSQIFQLQSLQQKELASASIAEASLQQKKLAAAASTAETSFQQKELAWLKAFKPESSTRASPDQLDTLQESGFQTGASGLKAAALETASFAAGAYQEPGAIAAYSTAAAAAAAAAAAPAMPVASCSSSRLRVSRTRALTPTSSTTTTTNVSKLGVLLSFLGPGLSRHT